MQANQDVGNYWFKAIPIGECNVKPDNANGIAILRYEGAPNSDPTGTQTELIPVLNNPPITVNKVFPTKTETWPVGMVGAITAAQLTSFNDMPEDLKKTPDVTLYIAMDQIVNDPLYNGPVLESTTPAEIVSPICVRHSQFQQHLVHFPELPPTTSSIWYDRGNILQ